MTSTTAARAALVRHIDQEMRRLNLWPSLDHIESAFIQGKLDAYADILSLIGDLDSQ